MQNLQDRCPTAGTSIQRVQLQVEELYRVMCRVAEALTKSHVVACGRRRAVWMWMLMLVVLVLVSVVARLRVNGPIKRTDRDHHGCRRPWPVQGQEPAIETQKMHLTGSTPGPPRQPVEPQPAPAQTAEVPLGHQGS